jgi:hypothetical protein
MAVVLTEARLKPLIFALGIVISVVVIARFSPSFQACIAASEGSESYRALYESAGFVGRFFSRQELDAVCTGTFLDQNSGILSGLAMAVIAWFAWGLARVARDLKANADRQIADSRAVREIVGKQATILAAQADTLIAQKQIAHLHFVAAHRPRLRVRYFTFVNTGQSFQARVLFTVHNVGATRAVVQRCSALTEFLEVGPMLGVPNLAAAQEAMMPQPLDIGDTEQAVAFCPYTAAEVDENKLRGRLLHVFGIIEYTDEADGSHTTAFCRYYDPSVRGFIPAGGEDYNYEA